MVNNTLCSTAGAWVRSLVGELSKIPHAAVWPKNKNKIDCGCTTEYTKKKTKPEFYTYTWVNCIGCVPYLIKAVKNVLVPWCFPFLLQSTLITPFSQLL